VPVEIADSLWKRTGKWLVELRGTPTRIGWVNVSGLSLEGGDSLSVGYEFAPSFWGHGFALKAITAVVDDCFERLDEPHLMGQVRWENDRSVRVLRKLGFRSRWVLTEYKDLTKTVELVSVPATLPVGGIYDGIKF
jgi:RimJ/RimL family protein N-acetyltransferase